MNHQLSREILGNVDGVSRTVFYLLSAAAIACFACGIWRRIRIWRMGRRGESRLEWGLAVRRVIRDVLFQRSVQSGRQRAGAAHVALFIGFCLLLLGTILVAIEHYSAAVVGRPHTNPLFHKGLYYAVFELTLDVAGLLLVAGCIYFFWRRWYGKSSMEHRFSDYVVLTSLIVIATTGYFVEGARIIREDTASPGLSPIGFFVADGMSSLGVTPQSVSTTHLVLWWVHAVAALGLIAAIPYCRLLHIVAGVANVATRNVTLGVLEPVTIEQLEAEGKVGVAEISDLTRGQLLALDACVSCGRCEDACPAHAAGKPLSPRNVVQDLRRHVEAIARRPVGGDEAAIVPGNIISEPTLWSCTTCGACVDVCPLHVAPLEFITDLRRYLVGEGRLSGAPATSLQKMQRSGNPWGLPASERFDWAAGLDVPTVLDNPDFEILYWVGCAASYDRRIQKVARAVVQLMKIAKVNFACLGPAERCTGDSARRMGDEFLFQELASQNIETLTKHNVRRIVTHCPHCLNSLTKDYSQFAGQFRVQHHSEFLAELIADSKLKVTDTTMDASVTFHDPCYLARVNEISDAPRDVLRAAVSVRNGSALSEMTRRREHTACCGAGGGRMWFDDPPNERLGQDRVQEVISTGAQIVAVACPFCLTMMSDGLSMHDSKATVKDIAELLAEAIGE